MKLVEFAVATHFINQNQKIRNRLYHTHTHAMNINFVRFICFLNLIFVLNKKNLVFFFFWSFVWCVLLSEELCCWKGWMREKKNGSRLWCHKCEK